MFHIATVLSVVAAIASASKPRPIGKSGQAVGLCAAFFSDDSKSALQIPVCPSTLAGSDLHYVCGDYASTDAAQVCASLGWRLAMLEEGVTTGPAYAIMNECAGTAADGDAWIGGYNGMAADPCMKAFLSTGGYVGAYANLGIQACQTTRANIICQDIPIITVTQTNVISTQTSGQGITINTVTRTATKTSTVTSHIHHNWCPCSSSSSSSSSSSAGCDCHCNCSWNCKAGDKKCKKCPPAAKGFIHKGLGPVDKRRPHHHHSSSSSSSSACPISPPDCNSLCNQEPACGGSCVKVCDVTAGNIRLLSRLIAPEDAAAECAKFGWSLLDMLSGQEADVKYVLDNCQVDSNLPGGAWMNSFDGVTANCTYAEINGGRVNAQYPIGGAFCEGSYQVLCQTGCPAPVGDGADLGIVQVSITPTSITSTVLTPTTTIVLTATSTTTVTRTVTGFLKKAQ